MLLKENVSLVKEKQPVLPPTSYACPGDVEQAEPC